MGKLRFTQIIKIRDGNPYVLVTKEQASTLKPNWRKPMPVIIQIDGKPEIPWHINMMPVGDGSYYLYLHGDVRKASKTKVGDTVTIEARFDTHYHNGPLTPLPDWFEAELARNTQVSKNWDSLPPSRQKEVVRYLVGLKSQAAISRNLEKVIRVLSGESGRFMARDWKDGK